MMTPGAEKTQKAVTPYAAVKQNVQQHDDVYLVVRSFFGKEICHGFLSVLGPYLHE